MKTKDRILQLLDREQPQTATRLAGQLGISRQAASRHLRDLIRAGLVVKEGRTKGARFLRFDPARGRSVTRKLATAGLQEDRVFRDLALQLNLRQVMNVHAFSILGYAFTEMLNNAIDHSGADECRVQLGANASWAEFQIRDRGVGAFASIREKFGLADEETAAAELLKGKATTAPEAHSGEGIFFSSKVGERMVLRSHRITIEFGASPGEVVLGRTRFIRGTEVSFRVETDTRRKLETVFLEYGPEEFDYRFERTRVLVRLFEGRCVSRSVAKRMVARLPEFSEVLLDFEGVDSIGQAFADEVFRVFLEQHHELKLQVLNLKPQLRPMIEHVMTLAGRERVSFEDHG